MTSTVAAAPCAVVMRKNRVVAVKKVAAASARVRSIALPAVAGELEVRPESACGRADRHAAAARRVVERRLRGGQRDAGGASMVSGSRGSG